jgi:signal transduction histidine kinase
VADTARLFAFVDADGYQSAFLSLVGADDGTWWAGTSVGLLRFDPRSATFRRFTIADGVQGNEFAEGVATRLSDGRLVFGGTSGATVVDPARLYDNHVPPAVVITGISVDDSILSPVQPAVRAGLQLPPGESVLRVSVAALDFRAPESNRLQYRISGFSELWRHVEGRSIMITHLDPGLYVLHVRGTNNDGLAGANEATLAIEVLPPWWQRWWFRLILAVVLVMAVVLIVRARVALVVREERLRARIARDLHDDVSSTLSSIMIFAEAVRTDRRRDAGRRRHYLDLIAESARSARDLIGDIIWSVDPQHDDWPSFLSKCERFASDLFESAGVVHVLQIQKDVSLNLGLVLRRNLWLIFKEVVTNVVRHSQASRVQVIIRGGDGHLLISVSDDGRGFDQSRARRGNGLANIQRRANEIGATVDLESRPGGGTTWTIQVRKGV